MLDELLVAGKHLLLGMRKPNERIIRTREKVLCMPNNSDKLEAMVKLLRSSDIRRQNAEWLEVRRRIIHYWRYR